MITQTRNKPSKSFDFSELPTSAQTAHTIAVGRNYQQTAKFRVSYSLNWRHTRQREAGFFVPVSRVPSSGYLPGVRGLQDGANRNKRIAYQLGNRNTRKFLRTPKTLTGIKAMNAITPMGNPARNASAHLTIGGAAA